VTRLVALLLAAALWAGSLAAAPASIPVPAAPGAMGSSLAQAPDGSVYLSWLEPAGPEIWALRFSRFEAAALHWSEPRTIAQGGDWFVNWADFPVLAVDQKAQMTAVWFVNQPAGGHGGHHEASYRALHAVSADRGTTWSAPQPITKESGAVEFVALQPLPDGRLLAAWLDGRNRRPGQDRQSLYARVLGAPGPDTLVDASVCDCCQLAFSPLPDGGALLAYRGRTPDEIRDMQLARFDGRAWSKQSTLNADGWKITGCPVNGPQLAADGQRLGAVWFTGADGKPQVLAKLSADAGKTFGPSVRLDLGRPQGRVDSVLLADGTLAVTWLEMADLKAKTEGGIYLRTLSPAGLRSEPRLLAPSSASRMSGFPRVVLLAGRRLLLTCTQDTTPSSVLTLLVDLP
jgi:hypothetical protein